MLYFIKVFCHHVKTGCPQTNKLTFERTIEFQIPYLSYPLYFSAGNFKLNFNLRKDEGMAD